MKQKLCHKCQRPDQKMFRCRKTKNEDWGFYCKVCMEEIRRDNPEYQYGGTWKGKKK